MSKVAERPATILLADDEHLVATGMATSLRSLGFEVIGPAADGEEALDLCRREKPDLALLDIRMPKIGGLDVARSIFDEQGTPVMIFSAFSDSEYVRQGVEAGVFGYLLKPVTQDQIRVGISIAWGRYREYVEREGEIGKLKTRLESRKLVEQAKWILVSRGGMEEPDAMKALQRCARNERRPLSEVAQHVIDEGTLPAPTPNREEARS